MRFYTHQHTGVLPASHSLALQGFQPRNAHTGRMAFQRSSRRLLRLVIQDLPVRFRDCSADLAAKKESGDCKAVKAWLPELLTNRACRAR